MLTFDDTEQTIAVTVGERFSLLLPSPPLAGYTWQASVEESYLLLEDQRFEPTDAAIGGWGRERLVFRALHPGRYQFELACRRPWEDEPRERRSVTVQIGEPVQPNCGPEQERRHHE